MQRPFGGLVKQQIAIERQKCRKPYDTIHVKIKIDWIHLESIEKKNDILLESRKQFLYTSKILLKLPTANWFF